MRAGPSDGDCCGEKKNAGQRVSETARDLFYRRGIRAVGVDEIVHEAGVTKPSLYRSFASKDALVTACLQEHVEENRALWAATVAEAPGDPRRQLSLLLEAIAAMMAGDEFRGCALSNAAVEFPDPEHPAHRLSCEMKTEMRANLLGLIGELGAARPEILADGLMLMIEGAQASRHVFCGEGPTKSLVPAAEALVEAFVGEKVE